MKSILHPALVSVGNVILGVLVFYCSGFLTEKTLYDRFVVRLDALSLPVLNLERSVEFYRKVLDFQLSEVETEEWMRGSIRLELPDRRKIAIELRREEKEAPQAEVIHLRVVNGFQNLHAAVLRRSGRAACANTSHLPSGCVSEIFEGRRGREFIIRDLDNNRLVFFQPKRFAL